MSINVEKQKELTNRKLTKYKLVYFGSILFVLIIIISLLFLSAYNIGKRNELSHLSTFIPTEQIDVLQRTGIEKSNYALLADALSKEVDPSSLILLNGRQERTELNIKTSYLNKVTNQNTTTDLSFITNSYSNSDLTKSTDEISLNGVVTKGLISVNISNQIKAHIVNTDSTYIKIDSNAQVNTILKATDPSITNLFNKWFKVDTNTKNIFMVPNSSPIYTKITGLFNDTYGHVNTFLSLNTADRVNINGKSSIKLHATINKTELINTTNSFVNGLIKIKKDNPTEFKNICKNTTTLINFGITPVITSILCSNNLDNDSIIQTIDTSIKGLDINYINFYINPYDNTLLKIDANVNVNTYGLEQFNGANKQNIYQNLEFTFTKEEISRGVNQDIQAPVNYEILNSNLVNSVQGNSILTPLLNSINY